MGHRWDEHYASGDLPWDTGEPARELVELFEAGRLPRGRALDVGCGTGASVLYLAGQGYDAMGVDVAGFAIDRAMAAAGAGRGSIEFRRLDFLADELPVDAFDLVFDRGCFHVFDDARDRARFAERVAGCLAPGGLWVSLIGSTEGPPRDGGPPRRSARDITEAVEPALEIVELRGIVAADVLDDPRGWMLLAQPRMVPVRPSTVPEG